MKLKLVLAMLFPFLSVVLLASDYASVTLQESPEQCYQDMKAVLFRASDWDDANYAVRGASLDTLGGEVRVSAQILSAHEWNKPKKNPDAKTCVLVVTIESFGSEASTVWNSRNQFNLQRIANQLAAQITSRMKQRQKAEQKAKAGSP